MYQIEICDDDTEGVLQLERILNSKLNEAVVHSVPKEHLQAELKENVMNADILFVNVNLGKVSGVMLAAQLQKANPLLRVIFLAKIGDDVSNIFEVEPTGLLIKPYRKDKVYRTLERAILKQKEKCTGILQLKNQAHLLRVDYKDVRYIESDRRYLIVHKKNGTDRARMKLSEMEPMLPDYFVRCHQSYIVNLHEIAKVTENKLTLVDGAVVPVSRSRRQAIREKIF